MPVTPLIEIFSSIQGEGVLLGCRQIFVRFANCNLRCDYCDTGFNPGTTCLVESKPGSGHFAPRDNPFDLEEATRLVCEWQHDTAGLHHSVVLTGGEPLLHVEALIEWLPDILPVLPVYLETNGTLPGELEKIIHLVDMVSMDIKGAAVCGVATPWAKHADFMDIAGEKLCQIKLVVDSSTPDSEVTQAAGLVSRHAAHAPFVLQPRTLKSGLSLDGKALLRLQGVAARFHGDVRVIPQVHPWLGVA